MSYKLISMLLLMGVLLESQRISVNTAFLGLENEAGLLVNLESGLGKK